MAEAENREKKRAYNREYYQKHKEERAAKRKAHYQEHLEEMREYYRRHNREYYQKHKEELRAKRRAARALKKENRKREEKIEMAVELEKCPECGSAGAAKVQGQIYLAGCSKPKCEHWVSGENSETGATMAEAVQRWNDFAREERAAKEEDERLLREEAGEEAPPEDDSPEEGEEVADPAGEPPAPPDDEEEDDDEAEEEEDEEAGEGDEETSARFWLELDGTWYWLESGCERCEGCAFRLAFGKREICAASSSEDFPAAATLCETVGGVWRKNEDAEDGDGEDGE